MWKWFKAQTTAMKVMILTVIMLLIGIIVSWEHVRKEAGEAWMDRFRRMKQETVIEMPAEDADSLKTEE